MAIGSRVKHTCQQCGHWRWMYKSQAAVTKFCSRACHSANRRILDAARFWSMTDRDISDCWLWTGNLTPSGYGIFRLGRDSRANRVAWILSHGAPIPAGMVIRHTCDTPRCVRPDHLVIGTHLDNQRDSAARGRRPYQRDLAAFARKFAKLTDRDVIEIRSIPGRLKNGQREALAAKFGVTFGCIKAIRGGVTWKWLESESG